MAYNPYGMYQPQNYDINAMQNQLAQLQQMQNQMRSPIQNTIPQPQGVIQVGTYVVVKTIQDMENYPVPVDGTPVNIFVEGTGVFYSKKMANGSTNCQPFSFSPLNNSTSQKDEPSTENAPEWAMSLIDRISALEKKQTRTKKVEVDNGDKL
jgi:hypothetical protein